MPTPTEIRRSRAPLIWMLLPTILGYTLCESGFCFETWQAKAAAAILAGTLAAVSFFSARKNPFVWKLTFTAAATFLAGAWWSLREPAVLEIPENFPETQIETTLEIEKPFRSGGKNWTGLARIRENDKNSVLDNTRVFYMIPKNRLEEPPVESAEIRVAGALSPWSALPWLNDDFAAYLKSRRASLALTQAVPAKNQKNPTPFTRWTTWCKKQKNAVSDKLTALGGRARERESGVLTAMTFGDRSRLPEIEKTNFQLTGTMHIFAVSGLHVAIVAAILSRLGAIFRLRERPCVFLILLFSWLYVQISGAAPSAVRAWEMICFYYIGKLSGRGDYTVPAIALVALLNLWYKPWLLTDLGFQLSYSVVLGIFLYALPLERFLREHCLNFFSGLPESLMNRRQKFSERLRRNILGAFSIAWTSFLATALLIAGMQCVFTPVSVFVNILLVPVAALMLPLAIFAGTLVCLPAGAFFAAPVWEIACKLACFCEWLTGMTAAGVGAFDVKIVPAQLAPIGSALILFGFFLGCEQRFLRERPLLRFLLPATILFTVLLCSSLFCLFIF